MTRLKNKQNISAHTSTATPGAAYEIKTFKEQRHHHVLAVIVDNEPGVLGRVIGLFSGRGYNIEGLTVSSVNEEHSVSRITIQTTGSEMVIEQIKAQLSRMVPVHDVHDLTVEGPLVCRETALIKVCNSGHERRESLRLASVFGATVIDTTLNSFVFEFTGSPKKIDALIELMRALAPKDGYEIVRSGAIAISRGDQVLTY
ncbi:MAG: acetolactate synthase small subunit [Pseudomonadota bacterium]